MLRSPGVARDPVCGMVVDPASALSAERDGVTYHFCNPGCRATFLGESPPALHGTATDPVCGMQVRIAPDALQATVRGPTYYFCSQACLRQFTEPERELRRTKLLAAFALASGALLMAAPMLAAWLFSALEVLDPDLLVPGQQQLYFEVAAIVLGFVLLGRWLEHLMRRKASEAVRKLLELQPTTARVLRGSEEHEVPIGEVLPGDVLVVRPGERIPVDGIVAEGASSVDESLLTGEAMPVDKEPGSEAIGGTMNRQGLLHIRAARVGQDTALARIVQLVEEAQTASAPIQRLVDVVSAWFVPIVALVALASFAGWLALGRPLPFAFTALVSVLLIACPCALGLATPAALVVGTSLGAQRGVLIKGGEFLERARHVDIVVFDKTGTLTLGHPEVTDIVAFEGTERDVLLLAAQAELGSEHPLGQAVVRAARQRGLVLLPAGRFEAVAGGGVLARVQGQEVLVGNAGLLRARGLPVGAAEPALEKLQEQGKTPMLVAGGGKLLGLLAVADQVRPEAREAVRALQAMGLEVAMLTGDNPRTAGEVARKLGIAQVLAEVPPAEKAARIRALQEQG
ncbi:MAG: heavy metal translocating P-type ATPase, partial [Halobacteriales archaeon]|nr:heavy metal translocating P-type ATPase [Halobacteriales archaeon]